MPEETPKKESKVALVLSILALSISAFAFYLDHFYKTHQLQAALVTCEFGQERTEASQDQNLNVKASIVAINGGKQTEVILSAYLSLTEPDAAFSLKDLHPQGPFILKSGEAKTITFHEGWSTKDLADWGHGSRPYVDVVAEFIAASSEGERVITKPVLYRMKFGPNGQFLDSEDGEWAIKKLIFTPLLHK